MHRGVMLRTPYVNATTLPSAKTQRSSGLSYMASLRNTVLMENACALPGVTIKYETFIPCMWMAVERGYVTVQDALFVGEGLKSVVWLYNWDYYITYVRTSLGKELQVCT